jgi:HSP20 family protein
MPRLLTAVLVLLCLVVILQLGLLLQRHLNRFQPAPVKPSVAAAWSPAEEFDDPVIHMRRMQHQIDALFAGAMNDFGGSSPGFDEGWTRLEITPGFSIRDTGDSYDITVHLPGVKKSDIQISLENSVLSLIVNKTTRTATRIAKGTLIRESQQASRFERHLRLPGATGSQEAIQAIYNQDVLHITVPKTREPDGEEINPFYSNP